MKVGLMLPLFEAEAGGHANLRAVALAAEASGLDSVWAPDHVNFIVEAGMRGVHECWTTLTAIAALTSRIEIGTMVLALPFRNPALLAKMAAELDAVSGGRLILGVGSGWHEPEFRAFGYPFDHLVSRFAEGLEILVPLLRGERVSFEGRFHRALDAELRPAPLRPGGPPILIGAKGPRMMDLTVRHAAFWNATRFGPASEAEELHRLIPGLEAAVRRRRR
jgi:alkanesulfonate monooxygenase SsuD/methylene tetrahydromethanopterin reductase-like flavin-dependent oxidoreductase (luciferase family)